MDLNELEKKINEYLTLDELAEYFEVSYSTVRYYISKHKLKTFGHLKNDRWTKEKILNACYNSSSKGDVLEKLGVSRKSGNYQTLYRYCDKFGIDIHSIKYINFSGGSNYKKLTIDEMFTENSLISGKMIKKNVISNNLIPYKCEKCKNNGEWQGQKLSLQLDHINGKPNDNRLENLRFLCPNCHSQTPTFSGKNKKK